MRRAGASSAASSITHSRHGAVGRAREPPGKDAIDLLVATMTQPFEIRPMLRNEIASGDREAMRLTEAQYLTLSQMRNMRRASVIGGAGTGKSLLAAEKARRLAKEGFRTLLVCFNAPLAAMLGDEVEDVAESTGLLETKTFHQLCEDLGREAGVLGERPVPVPQAWWDETLPRALDDAIAALGPRYHAIVVDEGQDFTDEWLLSLESLLFGGKEDVLYVFHDPAQAIYREDKVAGLGLPEIVLDQNCRNAQPIHDVVRRFAGEGHAELAMRSDGRAPELIEADTPEDTVRALRAVLHRLRVEEEVRPWDIAVLTGRASRGVGRVGGAGSPVRERGPGQSRRRRRGAPPRSGRPPRSAASRRRHPVRDDPPLQGARAPGHHPRRAARGRPGQARPAAVHRCVAGAATPRRDRVEGCAGAAAMSSEITRAERLAGAVWGHLVGDAVGVPYEFGPAQPAASIEFGATGTHGQPPGTWSDDGALMLALLDSLLTVGFDTTDQATRALDWYRRKEYTPDGDGSFDIGNTTGDAIRAFEHGTPAEDAGPSGEMANGNGSLMRILPLALVERRVSDAELATLAHRASRVTHGTVRAQVACALYCLVARRLLDGHDGRSAALVDARHSLRSAYEAAHATDHLAALDHLEAYTDRAGRGSVWDSFWSAWDAFAGANDYRETIQRAIAYGHDTDTTAAIAGGLAGIRWGIGGIPEPWLRGMRGRPIVEPLVESLTRSEGPIRVDWVDLKLVPGLADSPGRLGMTILPGKDEGPGGKHHRNLEQDVRWLREAYLLDAFLLLVEDHELAMLRVPSIAEVMAAHGIGLLRHPIVDVSVPTDDLSLAATLDDVRARLAMGESVTVACRGGLGRTGTVVGCLLRDGGLDGDAAVALVRTSRPRRSRPTSRNGSPSPGATDDRSVVGQPQEPGDGDAFVERFPPHPKAELDDLEISNLLG